MNSDIHEQAILERLNSTRSQRRHTERLPISAKKDDQLPYTLNNYEKTYSMYFGCMNLLKS